MYEDWKFHHVGLVINDIDKTIEYYLAMDMKVEKPVINIGNKQKVCFLRKADLSLELCQPIEPQSRQAQFLKNHGEGVDHISYIVSDLEKVKADMAEKGISVVETDLYPEKASDYDIMLFDTCDGGTTMLELRQLKLKGSSPDKLESAEEAAGDGWQFDHLAYIVTDVYKSLIFYMSLGFEVQLRCRVPKGVPIAAFCRKGPVTLMFHSHNDWKQGKLFFDAHGEGIDHIAFNVKNIEEEAAKISNLGFPMIGKIGSSPDAYRAFFETRKYGGLLLELAQPKMSLWW